MQSKKKRWTFEVCNKMQLDIDAVKLKVENWWIGTTVPKHKYHCFNLKI